MRSALQAEGRGYNNRQVHSSSGQIPKIRFERAKNEGNSLFHNLTIPKPHPPLGSVLPARQRHGQRLPAHLVSETCRQSPKRCLVQRWSCPLVPDDTKQLMHICIWWNGKMVQPRSLPWQNLVVRC